VQQLDAGEQIGDGVALATTARSPERVEKIVTPAIVADRRRGPLQQQDGIGVGGVEGMRKAEECGFLVVEPNHVAVDDKEGLAEKRQSLRDPAAGIKKLVLLGKDYPGIPTPGEMRPQHRRLVMNVDDDAFDSGHCQTVDGMVDQCTVVDFDQRLGQRFGHRTQPCAEPGCQHHRRARQRSHASPRRLGRRRVSAGR
jgi:hypothetical protein